MAIKIKTIIGEKSIPIEFDGSILRIGASTGSVMVSINRTNGFDGSGRIHDIRILTIRIISKSRNA
jgi:hypothetical protein